MQKMSDGAFSYNMDYSEDEQTNIYSNIYPSTSRSRSMPGCWRVKYIFLRWRSSVFKLIWHEVLMYIALYLAISVIYRFGLAKNPTAKQNFELLCIHCSHYDQPTPVAILTGFYVSNVVNRWWAQFMAIPWPDQLALKLVTFMPGRVQTFITLFEALLNQNVSCRTCSPKT